jgi:hypothetical protein
LRRRARATTIPRRARSAALSSNYGIPTAATAPTSSLTWSLSAAGSASPASHPSRHAVRLRRGHRGPAWHGRAVHDTGALARSVAERGVSGRPGTGHVHRRPVGALPHFADPDPRVPGRMVRGDAVGRHPRPLHPRGRRRLRAGGRESARRPPPGRGDPCRRDAMASKGEALLALGGAVFDHRDLPHRIAPGRGNPRSDR